MTNKNSVAAQQEQGVDQDWSKLGRGNRRPIIKYPAALFEVTEDPTDFAVQARLIAKWSHVKGI